MACQTQTETQTVTQPAEQAPLQQTANVHTLPSTTHVHTASHPSGSSQRASSCPQTRTSGRSGRAGGVGGQARESERPAQSLADFEQRMREEGRLGPDLNTHHRDGRPCVEVKVPSSRTASSNQGPQPTPSSSCKPHSHDIPEDPLMNSDPWKPMPTQSHKLPFNPQSPPNHNPQHFPLTPSANSGWDEFGAFGQGGGGGTGSGMSAFAQDAYNHPTPEFSGFVGNLAGRGLRDVLQQGSGERSDAWAGWNAGQSNSRNMPFRPEFQEQFPNTPDPLPFRGVYARPASHPFSPYPYQEQPQALHSECMHSAVSTLHCTPTMNQQWNAQSQQYPIPPVAQPYVQHCAQQNHSVACRSYEGQLYTSSSMNHQAPEFHPDTQMQSNLDANSYVFGNPSVPAAVPPTFNASSGQLLGPLLPGFVNSQQLSASGQFAANLASQARSSGNEFHNSATGFNPSDMPERFATAGNTLQQFLPTVDEEVMFSGSGHLPGSQRPSEHEHRPCSDNWPSLHSCRNPLPFSDVFRSQAVGPISGGNLGGWGAAAFGGEDEGNLDCSSFRPPQNMQPHSPPNSHFNQFSGMNPRTEFGLPDRPNPGNQPDQTSYGNFQNHPYPQPPPNPGPNRGPPNHPGFLPPVGGGGGGGGYMPQGQMPPGPPGGPPQPPNPPPQGPMPGGGGGGGNGPRWAAKRWLPPPAWTPGGQGQPTYRGFLWQLAGWSRLTGMPFEDRGTALALSLGGRAGRIAQSMPHELLGRRDGLFLLLQRIESELGSELQDRVRAAGRVFMRFRRPRNMPASEYISEYERLYSEGVQHGLWFNQTMLSMMLIEHCGLTEQQESWILQTVAADWTKYAEIRTALRRLPNLDHRHTTEGAQAWPVQDDASWPKPSQDHALNHPAADASWPKPFQDHALNRPAAESESWNNGSAQQEFTGAAEDADSDSDDDFCSSAPSDVDPEEFYLVQSAWAFKVGNKFAFRKKGKGKGRRKGFSRPKSVWAIDNRRNLSEEIPQGWEKGKWLARTPCPGCGSRWHRDCQGKGKAFPLFVKKKGGRKGAKGSSSSFGGKGKSGFGVFLATTATLFTAAQSLFSGLLPQPCQFDNMQTCVECSTRAFSQKSPVIFSPLGPAAYNATNVFCDEPRFVLNDAIPCDVPAWMNSCHVRNSLESVRLDPELHELPSEFLESETQVMNSVPAFLQDADSKNVFKSGHIKEWANSSNCVFMASSDAHDEWYADKCNTFVGLEPKDKDLREMRWETFLTTCKQRFALLIDTGAPESCVGRAWFNRFVNAFSVSDDVEWTAHKASLSGIGEGSAKCSFIVQFPIGLETGDAFWRSQLLDGIGEHVPPLLGLSPMQKRGAVIDLRDPHNTGKYAMHVDSNTGGRESLTILWCNGHIVLPVDWGGSKMPDKNTFVTDPLGLQIWLSQADSDTTLLEQQLPETTFPKSAQTGQQEGASSLPVNCSLNEGQQEGTSSLPSRPVFSSNQTETNQFYHPVTTNGAENPAQDQNLNKSKSEPPPVLLSFVAPVFDKPPGLPEPTHTNKTKFSSKTKPVLKSTYDAEKSHHALPSAQYALVKQMRKSSKEIQQLLSSNSTYNKKYRGLPVGTPLPLIDLKYTSVKKWNFWEWWSGEGILTRTAEKEGLVIGPPVTWNTGWCLKLQTHRDALRHLLTVYTPDVLFGAPTCAPWSNASTTFNAEVKEIVRTEELVVFKFFCECCQLQHRAGRSYLYEQPKSSELLRRPESLELQESTEGVDNVCCMCMHDLKDPFSQKPCMKASCLRGTIILTGRTNKWCDGSHIHQQLKGCLPNGVLRTSVAATYTKTFCRNVIRDIVVWLNASSSMKPVKNFPVLIDGYEGGDFEVEEQEYDSNTPAPPVLPASREERKEKLESEAKRRREEAPAIYPEPPQPISIPQFLQPTAKRLPKRDTGEPLSANPARQDSGVSPGPEPREEPTSTVGGSSSSKGPDPEQPVEKSNPMRELIKKWDQEEAKELPDAVLDLALPPPLEVPKSRPMTEEQLSVLNELKDSVAHRVPANGTATIQSGVKLKMLQELFGTPFSKVVMGAVIARKPKTSIAPEPLLSRTAAPLKLEFTLATQKSKWTLWPWEKYSTTFYAQKPLWLIMLYGRDSSGDELANHINSSPWDLLVDARIESEKPLASLPVFMKVLREGTEEEKIATVLSLHKRLYHKPAAELRKLLQKSGAALHTLSIVNKAVEQCDVCRNWAQPGAKPAVKVMHAIRFNAIVYVDLIFFTNCVIMICVDEAIRFTVLWVMEYKTTDSFIQAFRQCWIRWFGPPRVVRSDKEGALTAEAFGVSLERMGIQRELILADQQHSYLGILDRRVQIVRHMLPRITQELSADFIVVEPDDAAAECQFCINAMMQYRGSSPYECLYGQSPHYLFEEASEFISSNTDDILGFYEMHKIRAKAIQVFQESILQQRLERAIDSRPRSDNQSSYRIGQWVDIYRRPKQKSLEGWRGPAVVLAHLGEGFLTCRWQGICHDVPINHVRPHIVLNPHAALANSGPAPLEIVDAGAPVAPIAGEAVETAVANLIYDQCEWERYYNIESIDDSMNLHHSAHALVAVAASMPLGGQLLHVITVRQGVVMSSEQAIKDGHQLFNLGKEWAQSRNIQNYVGLIVSAGRRFTTQQAGVSVVHATWWVGDVARAVMQHSVLEGGQPIDWIANGITQAQLPNLRVLMLLQGKDIQGPPLVELLKSSSNLEPIGAFEQSFGATGRVRNHPEESPGLPSPVSVATRLVPGNDPLNMSGDTIVLDADGWDTNLPENNMQEVFVARIRSERLRNPEPEMFSKLQNVFCETATPSSASTCCPSSCSNTDFDERAADLDSVDEWSRDNTSVAWLIENLGLKKGKYFPLARDAGSLSPQDYITHEKECREAAIKELTAWVKMKAGKPVNTKKYIARTGLRPLPSRWVDIWKTKNKIRIIKRRLVLKGYAERHQDRMETSSPTATRIGHRMIMWKSAEWGLPIVSYDVSTAFLQGDTFETLNESGHSRQSCAFVPPAGVFTLLHEIDPQGDWLAASLNPSEWSIELDKGAYGLKDAPLLWFIRINRFMLEHSWKPMRHDACVYFHLAEPNKEINGLVSLHVDDTLGTGDPAVMQSLHAALEKEFGKISAETDSFRHFGVNVSRCPIQKHVFACQKQYAEDLKPIVLPKGKAEDKADARLTTEFRSLVSGIAWLGVTSAGAAAGASLYQSCLPIPSFEDIRHLNTFLLQLQRDYVPLVFRHGLNVMRIITISDSSLGNVSKYSQGGYFILLCAGDDPLILCGYCNCLSFRSAKSKRVASSTLHSECLGLVAGIEEASHLQTWIFELAHPTVSTFEMINAEVSSLVPIIGITDCKDLLDILTKTAVTALTNRSMTLYVAALREMRETKRVEMWCWCDTRDNVANALTKLNSDGSLPLEPFSHMLLHGAWEPHEPFRWGQTLCDPSEFHFTKLTPPPNSEPKAVVDR